MAMTDAEKQRRYQQRKAERIAAMPTIPCACGCGEQIPPINRRGEPARFKHGHNDAGRSTRFKAGQTSWMKGRKGEAAPNWRGGTYTVNGGYVRQRLTEAEAARHPTARRRSGGSWNIQRSHLVWNEAHPDDPVQPGEHVHHLNHVRDDDRIENLQKMKAGEHEAMHRREDLATGVRRRDEAGRFS